MGVVDTPSLKIKDVWVGNNWDGDRLQQLIGEELVEEVIREIGAGRTGQDILIWKPAAGGEFTIARAWELIRVRGVYHGWMDWIWSKYLPNSLHVEGTF